MSGTLPTEKSETLRVRSILVIDDMRLGAWLRSGEGIGWLAAGTNYPKLSLSSALLISFSGMCFLLLFLSFCRFVFVLFLFCFVFRPSSELLL